MSDSKYNKKYLLKMKKMLAPSHVYHPRYTSVLDQDAILFIIHIALIRRLGLNWFWLVE